MKSYSNNYTTIYLQIFTYIINLFEKNDIG